ncbi:acyl carrier protein [Nitrospina gracilis]|nr:acyl carrier protein [Nitrospina gracilis]
MDEKIIQTQLLNLLKPKLELFNISLDEVKVDDSLLELGILDSMSFLDFIVSLEEKFEMELDFSDMEPSEFFTIQQLSKIIFQNHNGS